MSAETPGPPLDHDALVASISERLGIVHDTILRAGRRLDDVTIVAVTKGFGAGHVRAARAAGLSLFGENYADELVAKATALRDEPGRGTTAAFDGTWTFQGRMQSNKINRLSPFVSLWQSVGSIEQATALAKRVPSAPVMVQVNLTGRVEQGGVDFTSLRSVVDAAQYLGLVVRGLMGIGPDTDDADARRHAFAQLRVATEDCGLVETSMGMSNDYADALAEGSTMIRVGSVLFGPRTP